MDVTSLPDFDLLCERLRTLPPDVTVDELLDSKSQVHVLAEDELARVSQQIHDHFDKRPIMADLTFYAAIHGSHRDVALSLLGDAPLSVGLRKRLLHDFYSFFSGWTNEQPHDARIQPVPAGLRPKPVSPDDLLFDAAGLGFTEAQTNFLLRMIVELGLQTREELLLLRPIVSYLCDQHGRCGLSNWLGCVRGLLAYLDHFGRVFHAEILEKPAAFKTFVLSGWYSLFYSFGEDHVVAGLDALLLSMKRGVVDASAHRQLVQEFSVYAGYVPPSSRAPIQPGLSRPSMAPSGSRRAESSAVSSGIRSPASGGAASRTAGSRWSSILQHLPSNSVAHETDSGDHGFTEEELEASSKAVLSQVWDTIHRAVSGIVFGTGPSEYDQLCKEVDDEQAVLDQAVLKVFGKKAPNAEGELAAMKPKKREETLLKIEKEYNAILKKRKV